MKFRQAAVAAVTGMAIYALAAGPGLAKPDEFSPRVRGLIAQMTQEEKLAFTTGGRDPNYGGQAGFAPGVPRLNIPPLRLADGPVGILNRYETTALPQAIGLAATFSPELAGRYGRVLGREARATNMDVVLGPMVNIARTPNWGRNITSYGEDPFLTSQMVVPAVKAIQAEGAMATTKHFIANNQSEHQGGGLAGAPGYDFVVDQRTLHEIYAPGFEAAVEAGTASIMAAYNRTNGYWNAENPDTLTSLLRGEFGWDGFVMSDWHANRSTESIAAGLDLEMPGFGPLNQVGREGPKWGPRLGQAIAGGKVPQAALDTAVGRILSQMERFGMLDGKRIPAPPAVEVEADAAVARDIATKSAVLLKNDGALPLSEKALSNIVLIGPTAGQIAVGPGGGRSEGVMSRLISPVDALKAAAGAGAKVQFSVGDDLTGVAIPASALSPAEGSGQGLTRERLDGSPPTVDAQVDFTGERALPAGRGYVWKGVLKVPTTGRYMIMTQSWGGATNLKIDGELKAGSARLAFGNGVPRRLSSLLPTTDNLDNGQTVLQLEAGRSYRIELEGQAEPDLKMQVRLAWVTPEMRAQAIADAVAAARAADTAVVFAWARGGEGFDPEQNLNLPGDQNALIEAVADANPNTVVVLNTGGPISMPWRDKVKAVLEMWFPGQEGGWATADLLVGKANPAGKLPITFPVKASDTPALAPGHPERFDGVGERVVYSEGIFVGYRHYDQNRIQPLYPFGYGLSYTTFAYTGLKVAPAGDGIDVSFTVRNTGKVKGAEIPQVYVGPPPRPAVPMAPKVLAGFDRLELEPGESRAVSIHVPARQLSYWSVEAKDWRVAEGRRPVYVGASSRDIRLTGAAAVRGAR
jgi:beta-glucosidase